MAKARGILAIVLLLGCAGTVFAQNCCLPQLGEGEDVARLIDGIWTATAVLLAAPFTLILGGSVWFFTRGRSDSCEAESNRQPR